MSFALKKIVFSVTMACLSWQDKAWLPQKQPPKILWRMQ